MTSDHYDADLMGPIDSRHQAWKDGLSAEQLAMVKRIEGMPPEMALHYMWVDLDAKINNLGTPWWKRIAAPLGVGLAAAAAWIIEGPRYGG